MASPQLQTLVQMLRAQPFQENQPVAETRAGFEMMGAMFPLPNDIRRETVNAGGVPGEWITAPTSSEARTIFYLHGGGYVIGSTNTHGDLVGRLARAAGARALSLNYRLAPEHPHPAAVDDATAAYRWLLSQGTRPETIIVAGDSAGGGLTAATLLALKAAGDPLPGAALMFSPWTDLTLTSETMKTHADRDPVLRPSVMGTWAAHYYGSNKSDEPLISPLFGDYNGLPPTLIITGSEEILLDDSRTYAERAKAAGVNLSLEVWDEMIHVFPLFGPMLPEGQKALDRAGEWIRQHVTEGVTA